MEANSNTKSTRENAEITNMWCYVLVDIWVSGTAQKYIDTKAAMTDDDKGFLPPSLCHT